MNLTVNKNQAYASLQIQIRKGREIEGMALSGLDFIGIPKMRQALREWEIETEELLLEIFDSPIPAGQFNEANTTPVSGDSIDKRFDSQKQRVRARCMRLESIRDKILRNEEDTVASEVSNFWDLLHPAVVKAAKSRFDSGHYADAVESALKYLNTFVKHEVKLQTGKEYDGAALMQKAFSPNDPLVILGDLDTESGKNIQRGYMDIYAGVMTGIRNPKAHNVINIDPEEAIHLLFLASMLVRKLVKALEDRKEHEASNQNTLNS